MKKIMILFVAIAALFTTQAKAQLENDTEGYSRIEASYVSQILSSDEYSVPGMGKVKPDDEKTKGAMIGYLKGFNITNKLPLFLELGGQMQLTHSKKEIENFGVTFVNKATFMNIAIPVNVAYKFAFASSENFTIVPFIGPNFKFNIIGKYRSKGGSNDEELSFFDEDEVEKTANRLQIGLNLGVGVNIAKKLYVGYRFQPDFTKYGENPWVNTDMKTKCNYFTLGVNL